MLTCPKSCGNEKKRQCGQVRLSFVLVTIPGHHEHEARGFSPGRPISDDAAQTFYREKESSQRRSLRTGHRAILANSQQPIARLTVALQNAEILLRQEKQVGEDNEVCAMIRKSSLMTGEAGMLEAAYSSCLKRLRTRR